MGVVGSAIHAVGQFLAPSVCPACERHLTRERADGVLCEECDASAPRLPQERCALCGAPLDTALELCQECLASSRPWIAGTCAFPYDGPAGEWLRAYKYGAHTALAPFFAREMALAWKAHHGLAHPSLITAIPLHWTRQRTRGFNQASILAEMLAPLLGMEYKPLLRRRRSTGHQARLTGASRLQNLRHAFEVPSPAEVAGKAILVVDDVFTTGATLTAACQALLDAGAAETAVLAVARA